MFGLGPMELTIVLMIVLVLFGAKKLPQIGDGMGRAISNFKRSISDEKANDPEREHPHEISEHAEKSP